MFSVDILPMLETTNAWLALFGTDTGAFLKGLLQVGVLVAVFSMIYSRFIRRSQAEQLVKGVFVTLMVFVLLWVGARILDLTILEIIFAASIQILFIGMIVIFQPELRRMLMMLGQGELFGFQVFSGGVKDTNAEYLVHELVEAVRYLSKSRHGALIVLEAENATRSDYLEVGTALDAKISTELILTIFHPTTPLHDGALVVSNDNRIIAAGVLLPLTENPELSWQYGTRHRAAIGLTEVSDSRCLVVSEETGSISLVHDGKLQKIENTEDLKKALEKIYHVNKGLEAGMVVAGAGGRFSDLMELSSHVQRMFQSATGGRGDGDERSEKRRSGRG